MFGQGHLILRQDRTLVESSRERYKILPYAYAMSKQISHVYSFVDLLIFIVHLSFWFLIRAEKLSDDEREREDCCTPFHSSLVKIEWMSVLT